MMEKIKVLNRGDLLFEGEVHRTSRIEITFSSGEVFKIRFDREGVVVHSMNNPLGVLPRATNSIVIVEVAP